MATGDKYLKRGEVMNKLGMKSPSTLYRWINAGEFPAAKKLGGSSVGWLESEVNEWIQTRPSVR